MGEEGWTKREERIIEVRSQFPGGKRGHCGGQSLPDNRTGYPGDREGHQYYNIYTHVHCIMFVICSLLGSGK